MEINNDLALFERYISVPLSVSSASFLLNESQGMNDSIVPISEDVLRQILETIKPIVEKNHFYSGTIKIDKSNMKDPFFDSLTINFAYLEERVPIADLFGSYDQDRSNITKDNADVVINISSHAQDNTFINKLRNTIIHELTHAYDDYIETKNSKYGKSYARYEMESIINRLALAFYLEKTNTIEGKLAEVISFILKSEREAEQTEFLSDVMRLTKMRIYTDPRNLTPYVSNTLFYKNMMRIKGYLKEIEDLENNEEKIRVVNAFNNIYQDKIMTYDQICSFLERSWNFRKNELFKHVAKHIFNMIEDFVRNPVDCGKFMASLYENYGEF